MATARVWARTVLTFFYTVFFFRSASDTVDGRTPGQKKDRWCQEFSSMKGNLRIHFHGWYDLFVGTQTFQLRLGMEWNPWRFKAMVAGKFMAVKKAVGHASMFTQRQAEILMNKYLRTPCDLSRSLRSEKLFEHVFLFDDFPALVFSQSICGIGIYSQVEIAKSTCAKKHHQIYCSQTSM